MRREVTGEGELVMEAFAAVLAGVRVLAGVLLDFVALQLNLPTELLRALAAGVRQKVHVVRHVVAVHVALVGEHLMAIWLLAGDGSDLGLRLMARLLVAVEVRRV